MDGNGLSLGVTLGAAVCVSAAVLVLPGCGETKVGSSHEAAGAMTTSIAIRIPDADQLRVPLAADGFDTSDFMALGGCDLQATLGKYQSSLGRRASDSQRLLLDLEYLLLAPVCIEHLQALGKTELANVVAQAQKLKREQLSAVIFNATLGNTAFYQFWHKPVIHTVQSRQQQLALSAVRAINDLTQRWLAGDYRASNIEFEIYLSEIARGRLFSRDGLNAKELHRALASLEQQLGPVLPHEYQKWQTDRGHFFARLDPLTKLD